MAKVTDWTKVKGAPKNVYRVIFRSYSAYDGNWSVCERDVDGVSEDDVRHWAKDFMDDCYRFWKEARCNNKIELKEIRKVTKRPGFPSMRSAEYELALEGYWMDD